jgi:hypothetical protein
MLATIIQLVGVVAIVAGVAILSVPIAIIVGGASLVLIGLAVSK